ncbi:MAG: saccharopine dehydrogenase C-terminal domain-containing protein [Bacteroidota bacterium]|nr:saccharopine dehydrogenase C-terminal domain-containing protein [Bacteroidota bacterium]
MKKILVIGAGLSSASLIDYLLEQSSEQGWQVTVGDMDIAMATSKCHNHPNARPIQFDIQNEKQRAEEIAACDIVISLLPPMLHPLAAVDCVKLGKHLVTASYVSPFMQDLHEEAVKKDIILLNECGLDPGIDHLSAMKVMDEIRERGGEITSFRSYCGGLVAPEFDNNPWHYKFTWNPRNVILAGQATAQFLKNGKIHYITPQRIFSELETIDLGEKGIYEAYANRDSLNYIIPYQLQSATEVLRGTLRIPPFCEGWNVLVSLGLTDDSYKVDCNSLSYKNWVESYLPKGYNSINDYIKSISINQETIRRIEQNIQWLGLYSEELIPNGLHTPAQIIQNLLARKWRLEPQELDMIVMHHIFEYEHQGRKRKSTSTLIVKGKDQLHTAMAQTVGLPLGLAAKLILRNKIAARGVIIPTQKELYLPILSELEKYHIIFEENNEQ